MLDTIKTLLPTAAKPPAAACTSRAMPLLASPGSPGLRKPPRHRDEALTGTARHWLRHLPARRRPLRLCADHPRVANRIAWSWADPAATALVLDDLLTDHRGGRRGFSSAITRELQRLLQFNAQHRVETQPESFWAAVGRVIGAD